MSERNTQRLPEGWVIASLPEIAAINPATARLTGDDATPVNFVPMRAVEPEGGGLANPEVRPYGEVKKGYTSFLSGDVIMAKITPCMENGKTTAVPDLPGKLCFGSTEFHVIRAEDGVQPKWISNFLLQHEVRRVAQRQMTGGVGQMRVPASFLQGLQIPVAPIAEQQRISDALDELLSDLDAGVEALQRAQAKLALYRASVLKAAVQGDLTAEWRKQHPDAEPASVLLQRILVERRQRWEQEQVRKFKAAGKTPPANWKAKYKEPVAPDTTNLPELPKGWCWTTVEMLAPVTSGQTPSNMPMADEENSEMAWFRVADMNVEGNETWMTNGGLRLTHATWKQLGLKAIPADSIVFPKRGGAIATNKKRRLRFSAGCDLNIMAVSPSGGIANFLWTWFQTLNLAKLSDGSNVPQINNPDIALLPVPLPPEKEQGIIVESVEDQLSVIDHIEADLRAKVRTAASLRQSVYRHAFTGQLVPQDPKDEPAGELLKRIAAEREARKKIKATPRKQTAKRQKREE